ncbi:carbohydrate ABC transporter permease [Shumkonia mesophila]|uniref:carbohydrate ABC transporter permease n=1 Tax=Shumkonia mesophila TaxID=2838854 RepID=UPI002934FFB7|nr:sugar ABC transporter permease [Shumkonia mesophila]
MILPTILVLAIVVGYPIIYTLVLSVQDYNLLNIDPAVFVGAENYRNILTDRIFWQSLANTAVYTFGSVGIATLIGLAMALLMENLGGAGFRVIRALLVTPWAVPFVVVAFLFRYMYAQKGGIINAMLTGLGIIDDPISWLNVASLAMPSVMVANIWAMAPFFFLLLSATLAGIPVEVIESARVDRTRTWSMIYHIKLPYLRNPLLIGSLLMIIANFNDFAKIWAMTQGGPGYSTSTLVIYVYRVAFENFEFGYASALGVLWLALLFIFALAYMRALRTD